MKIALLGDIHFCIRNGSIVFQKNIHKFFTKIFFPIIQERGITQILQSGDIFDSRKANNNIGLANAKECFFDVIESNGYTLHVIVGNHDIHYLHTIFPNSIDVLLSNYKSVKPYYYPETVKLGTKSIDMIPWVCDTNREDIFAFMKSSKSDIVFGHFEISGFEMSKGHYCETGIDRDTFNKYSRAWSGHFHKQSKSGNIEYLGSPSQHTWDDVDEPRGFYIYDTETDEMEFIENPYNMFVRIPYTNDTKVKDIEDIEDKFVKIILPEEYDLTKFTEFIDELYTFSPIEIKTIESKKAIVGMEVSLEDIESSSFSMVEFLTDYTLSTNPEIEPRTEELFNLYNEIYQTSMRDE